MIQRHQQLFRHDPKNGVWGDCFRTVIACLLSIEPKDVPHFCDGPDDGKMNERVRAFLEPRGMILLGVPYDGEVPLERILQIGAAHSQGMHYLLTGKSRTGTNYVVICKGAEIIHDPSITQSGIVGPCTDGFYWIEWLVGRLPHDELEIEIDGRWYRKFIHYPKFVNDGTLRCIACGQIDEPEYHDDDTCANARAM
ncbi:hypothetical protein ACRQ1B_06185 [Rhizobium panacihumi]|uniref:hypothetical protein n=1 Tax=Rhizobium panacihumi TaxID=2008450 RepID=UPI003D7AF1FB